jgi:predicted metalloprotease with PDZ domain
VLQRGVLWGRHGKEPAIDSHFQQPQAAPDLRRGRRARLLWIALATAALAAGMSLTGLTTRTPAVDTVNLSYEVTVSDAVRGRLDVILRVSDVDASSIHVGFSTNTATTFVPASKYRLREVIGSDGRPLTIEPRAHGWRISPDGSALEVHYEVHLESSQTDGAFAAEILSRVDAQGSRLVGSDVFLFPSMAEAYSIQVDYHLPPGWRLVHPFQEDADSAVYPTLTSLYTSVVAAGRYRVMTRRAEGCELVVAVQGRFTFGDDDLMEMIGRIADLQLEFFDGPVRPRHVFVVNPHPHSDDPDQLRYFGLHFDGSMIVLLDERTDRRRLQAEPAQICAHEFFHNWNGGVIQQDRYEMNWFVEGVTVYYAYQFRMDARMLDPGTYAQELRHRYHREFLDNPQRMMMSVAQAGETVLQEENTTRLLYAGGVLVAVALDTAIDEVTQHERSLDDLMRMLVDRASLDEDFRLTRSTLEAALLELTGRDFAPWLRRYVYGKQALPLPAFLTTS